MAFNPEEDDPRLGNIPASRKIFWTANRFFLENLTALRQTSPRISEVEIIYTKPIPTPTTLLTAEQIVFKSINGFINNPDQLEGTIEFEVLLTKDKSPYDPLLERYGKQTRYPVIVVAPEFPPCFTDSEEIAATNRNPDYKYPRIDLSDKDCIELERLLGQPFQVITQPEEYGL